MADSVFSDRYQGPLTRWLLHLLHFDPPSDPWAPELDQAVRSIEAVPLCLNCLYSQERHRSFCPHCDFPTGDFVALNPYLQIYWMGEILRKGVLGPPEPRLGVQVFLVIYSFAEYVPFAPFYWFWMLRRSFGKPICVEVRRELPPEEFT